MAISGFLGSMSTEVAGIFVVIMGVMGIAFLYPVVKKLKNIVPYVYPNARIRAKEAKLIKSDTFEEMISVASLSEVISMLENTDHLKFAQSISIDKAEDVETPVDKYMADLYWEIASIVPKKDLPLMKTLMAMWDARNLKLIVRNVHLFETGRGGKTDEDIIKLMVRSPMEKSIKNLVDARTMDEMATGLEGSAFDLSAYIPHYRQTGSLSILENALYRVVYEVMLKELPPNEPEVKRYFSTMVGVQNLKTLLRAKRDGMSYRQIEPFLIKNAGLAEGIAKSFDELGITDMINGLEGTVFYKPLTEVLPEYDKEKSLSAFENVLDGLIARTGMDISTSHPFGMGPIIGFLSVKDMEAKNLKRIMTAKYLNLPADEIKPLMINA
ncbi:MAG: hypothetical protein EF807_06690 [Candidatus Methanolliviera hydrocarbonicum]|jgi:Archaeal/vacuolar-type H+-ATPase subunit C|uniref:V-type ATP synthase subunit C n=1 Tax=Candidatus Methanolliviera hydrocarbonicum TaxID=2491085 RepID=A0A520KVG4_9EURY|nr:MAG: hypothetical protein EF807_06690 [Candidatus Methanolliviera hydrocarbonicum]